MEIVNNANHIHLTLAFDYGTKYLGMAIGRTPYTINCLPTLKQPISNNELRAVIQKLQPDLIIIGYPLNMDGSRQPLTDQVDEFINRLRKISDLTIEHADERLSTYEARKLLNPDERDWKKLNALSAKVILKQWLMDKEA